MINPVNIDDLQVCMLDIVGIHDTLPSYVWKL